MSKRGMNGPPERRRWRTALISISVVVFLAAGTVTLYAWNLGRSWDSQTEKIADAFPSDELRPPLGTLPAGQNRAQNILLLGSDTRGSVGGSIADLTGQRSDSIMVAHIPADRRRIHVVSLMRDSWVEIPGHGHAKINAALSLGGVPLAVQTVEGILGVRMDHVAVIDFTGFVGVTDALGGVSIDNPVAFESSHLSGHVYPKGPQNMSGEEALAFVRERYAFADGDFQRTRNQQQFVKAVMSKVLTAETLTRPARVTGLVDAIAPHLAVDEGLDSGYLAQLGAGMRDVRVDDVVFFGAPTDGTGTSPDGQSIVNVDWSKLAELKHAFETDDLNAYTPAPQSAQ